MEHLFQDTPIAAVVAAGAFAFVLPPLLVLCRGKNKRRVKIVNDQEKQRRRALQEGREQTSERQSTRSKRDKEKSRTGSSLRPLSSQENAQSSARSQKYSHLFTGFPFKKNPLSQESEAPATTPAEPDRRESSHRSHRRERSGSHRSHSSKRSHRHSRSIAKEERTQSSESDRKARSRRGADDEDTNRDSSKQPSSRRRELSKKSDQREIGDIRKGIRQRIQSDSHRTLSADKSASSRTPTGPEEKNASHTPRARKNATDGEKDKSAQSCVKSNSVDVRSRAADNGSNSGSSKVAGSKQAEPKASKRTDADTSPTGASREKARQKPHNEHGTNKHPGQNAKQPSKPAGPPESRTDDSKGTATSDGQLARRPKKHPAHNGTKKLKPVQTWDGKTGKDAKGHGKPVKPAKKSSIIGKLFRTNKGKDGASKPGKGKDSKHGKPSSSGKR